MFKFTNSPQRLKFHRIQNFLFVSINLTLDSIRLWYSHMYSYLTLMGNIIVAKKYIQFQWMQAMIFSMNLVYIYVLLYVLTILTIYPVSITAVFMIVSSSVQIQDDHVYIIDIYLLYLLYLWQPLPRLYRHP